MFCYVVTTDLYRFGFFNTFYHSLLSGKNAKNQTDKCFSWCLHLPNVYLLDLFSQDKPHQKSILQYWGITLYCPKSQSVLILGLPLKLHDSRQAGFPDASKWFKTNPATLWLILAGYGLVKSTYCFVVVLYRLLWKSLNIYIFFYVL